MKAAPFDYVRVEHLDGALALLETHGGDAKLIAGGQSLVPMMAMRLARPALLVDIHNTLTINAIRFWGSSHLQQTWLPKLAHGTVSSFALSEDGS